MKESIEKKLGCTIEEHFEKMRSFWDKQFADGRMEVETNQPIVALTDEELDYYDKYVLEHFAVA